MRERKYLVLIDQLSFDGIPYFQFSTSRAVCQNPFVVITPDATGHSIAHRAEFVHDVEIRCVVNSYDTVGAANDDLVAIGIQVSRGNGIVVAGNRGSRTSAVA